MSIAITIKKWLEKDAQKIEASEFKAFWVSLTQEQKAAYFAVAEDELSKLES